jgi:hypothetical protein
VIPLVKAIENGKGQAESVQDDCMEMWGPGPPDR